MKRKLLLFGLLAVLINMSYSQKILFQEHLKDYSIPGTKGQGLKSYKHGYFGIGFILPLPDTTIAIMMPASYNYTLGLRLKRKITHTFSVGMDYNLNVSRFRFKQTADKVVPDTIMHKKQTNIFYAASAGVYGRITYGRHGNYIGKYVDIGIKGDWYFAGRLSTTDKKDGQKSVNYTWGMKQFQPLNGHAFLRMGLNRYAIDFSYRLLSMYKPAYYVKELPPFSVGVEVGFFK